MIWRLFASNYLMPPLLTTFLSLLNPSWLNLAGVGPYWPLLWLLPFSLESGPLLGAFAGLSQGILMDSIGLAYPSQIPALVFLGFWWGRIGSKGPEIKHFFSIGLLVLTGTVIAGFSFWLQIYLSNFDFQSNSLFNAWSLKTICAQSFITSILAPLVSSWLLQRYRLKKFS
tara:strand:+ start:666 stop:1178 length:513 start_codon:yes stop_codon:yes gene_type:complete